MNSTGGAESKNRLDFAFSNTSRTSFTPALIALSVKNLRSSDRAIICASVVLPTPGGPHRMKEERFRDATNLRNTPSGPTRWV